MRTTLLGLDRPPYNPAVTLILTAMTPNSIVQVSDMRLTNAAWKVVDEMTAKTVVYEGRALWAFTGPACMDKQPTAVWLANLLADNGPDEIVEAIRTSADSILRRYPPRARPFAVVAAGWEGTSDALWPHYRQIANFDFGTGELWPRVRATEVRLDPRRDKAKVFAAGVELPQLQIDEVEALVRRRAGRRAENAGEIAALLLATFSRVAMRHPLVGRRALIGSIPRAWLRTWRDQSIDDRWARIGGNDDLPGLWLNSDTKADWTGPAFVYHGTPRDPVVHYRPGYAAPGVSMASGIVAFDEAPASGTYDPCRSPEAQASG